MKYQYRHKALWIPGDYREAASIRKGAHTIDSLAAHIGAQLESYIEDGLGPARSFGAVSSSDRQIAFEFFEQGPGGPNLLVAFENGKPEPTDVVEALEFFGVAQSDVYWLDPSLGGVEQLAP